MFHPISCSIFHAFRRKLLPVSPATEPSPHWPTQTCRLFLNLHFLAWHWTLFVTNVEREGGGSQGRINLFSFSLFLFNYFSFLPLFACCFARYFNVSHPPTILHAKCKWKGLVARVKMPASSLLVLTGSRRRRIEGKHRLEIGDGLIEGDVTHLSTQIENSAQ